MTGLFPTSSGSGTASLLSSSEAFLRNTFRQLVARATPEGSHSPKTDAEAPYPEP